MRLGVRSELCSGCRVCQALCAMENFGEANPKKASLKVIGEFPKPGKYQVVICSQCGECAEVCPVGAIKNEDGVYRIDEEECIGCNACVDVCPEGVMMTHPSEDIPFKCTLCGECIRYCPRGALYDIDQEAAEGRVG